MCFSTTGWHSSERPTKEMMERMKRLDFVQQKAMWALGFVRHIVVVLSTSRNNQKRPMEEPGPGVRTESEVW